MTLPSSTKVHPDEYTAKRSYLTVGLVLLLLAVAFILRFYGLSEQSYWMDESFSINLAESIAHHGQPLPGADTGSLLSNFKNSLGIRGPIYHYLLAAVTTIFGSSEYATRGLSAVIGLSFVALIGWISLVWFDKMTSLSVMLLVAVNYWQIAWSRQARDYMLLCFLFWLAIFLMERGLALWPQKKKYITGAAAAGVMTAGIHPMGLLLLPAAIFLFIIKKITKISSPTGIILYPIFILLALKSSDAIIYLVHKYFGTGPSYLSHYSAFLQREYWPFLLVVPFVLLAGKRQSEKEILFWLLSVFFFGLLVIANGIPLLAYRYIFFLTPVIILFGARGVGSLFRKKRVIGVGTLALMLTIQLFNGQAVLVPRHCFFLESDSRTSPFPYKCYTPQPRFKEAYAYINKLGNINLITPYPTISRLYRKDRDILALKIRLKDYPGTNEAKKERYTGIPFLTFPAFAFLQQSDYDVYFLMDFFSQTRMDPLLNKLIKEHSTVVKVWQQPEWSDLTLYKLNHRQDAMPRSGILRRGR